MPQIDEDVEGGNKVTEEEEEAEGTKEEENKQEEEMEEGEVESPTVKEKVEKPQPVREYVCLSVCFTYTTLPCLCFKYK